MKYQLIRSKRRKTIALQITGGEVFIRAPEHTPEDYIEQLYQQKRSWIQEKVGEQLKANSSAVKPKQKFIDGAPIYLWGNTHTIQVRFVSSSKKRDIYHDENRIYIELPKRLADKVEKQQSYIKNSLEQYFKYLTNQYIEQKLPYFIERTTFQPASIKIKKYKARWGSCNSRQELSFNYLLAMAPHWVIDYVLVHELCHIKELNHSKRFWLLVEQSFPEYKKAKLWFKAHALNIQW